VIFKNADAGVVVLAMVLLLIILGIGYVAVQGPVTPQTASQASVSR